MMNHWDAPFRCVCCGWTDHSRLGCDLQCPAGRWSVATLSHSDLAQAVSGISRKGHWQSIGSSCVWRLCVARLAHLLTV